MQANKIVSAPKTIGIIGGGQLGRMLAIAAKYMGYRINVLDPTPDCPCAQVADNQIIAAYDNMDAIQKLTSTCNVVTYEFENVNLQAAAYIEQCGKLPQGSYALAITQNREQEKQLMKNAMLPVPNFAIVHTPAECNEILKDFSFPVVIKTCRGGYDGKGQLKLESQADIGKALTFVANHKHCIIEEWISFEREISVLFTRSISGEIKFFPIAENEHKDHILYQTMVPATISETVKKQALHAARILAREMKIVGTFTIEMFVRGDQVYLNEMAPRPHNSGHYTIEACNISQFAQHIRAICGLPLMDITLFRPAIMLNILGDDMERVQKAMSSLTNGYIHLYGKEQIKAKRKMGHLTFMAETVETLQEQVATFREAIR